MIRTRDPLLPKQMLYQAELRPDAHCLPVRPCSVKHRVATSRFSAASWSSCRAKVPVPDFVARLEPKPLRRPARDL